MLLCMLGALSASSHPDSAEAADVYGMAASNCSEYF